MPKAIWNGTILVESDETVIVEGNHYFPPESLNREYFRSSSEHSTCPWKGDADYYDVVIGGSVNEGAAWFYPHPKPAAENIKGHVAFWNGQGSGAGNRRRSRPALVAILGLTAVRHFRGPAAGS